MNATELVSTIRRRPTPSLTGPESSWPTAMPAMNSVIVSWAVVEEVASDRCTSGMDAM